MRNLDTVAWTEVEGRATAAFGRGIPLTRCSPRTDERIMRAAFTDRSEVTHGAQEAHAAEKAAAEEAA